MVGVNMAEVITLQKSSGLAAGLVQPAINYSQEDVDIARTAIAKSRAEIEEETEKTRPVIEAPSFLKDPLGWLKGLLDNLSQGFMEETDAKIEGNAQYRAEQYMAQKDPAFAEALRQENQEKAEMNAEWQANKMQGLASKFQRENGTDNGVIRFDGDEGNKAMPDAVPYIPKAPGASRGHTIQRERP